MEELVEKIHNVEVKEDIAFEELKTLEEEIDSITIVNSKFLILILPKLWCRLLNQQSSPPRAQVSRPH